MGCGVAHASVMTMEKLLMSKGHRQFGAGASVGPTNNSLNSLHTVIKAQEHATLH